MRTLDSGIGTFPLPDYASNAAGKLNPKLQSSSVSHQAAMKPRKTRTLEGGLASLDEVNTSVLYTSPLEAKGTSVHLSSTIHEGVYTTHPFKQEAHDSFTQSSQASFTCKPFISFPY